MAISVRLLRGGIGSVARKYCILGVNFPICLEKARNTMNFYKKAQFLLKS